eukprot:Gb_38264 [translate_table: standard]
MDMKKARIIQHVLLDHLLLASCPNPQTDRVTSGEEDAKEKAVGEEEDTGAQVAPIVKLDEVAVTTGEENEEVLLDMKAKLYRFDKDGNQWKERGLRTVKPLRHEETTKDRLEHAGSDKSWVWHSTDFSNGKLKEELFCIRLDSAENAKKFKVVIEEIVEAQAEKSDKGDKAADSIVVRQRMRDAVIGTWPQSNGYHWEAPKLTLALRTDADMASSYASGACGGVLQVG